FPISTTAITISAYRWLGEWEIRLHTGPPPPFVPVNKKRFHAVFSRYSATTCVVSPAGEDWR
ncbi:MAG: hypothetical protein AAAC47_02160, partial [Pararhizobium sp.]